MKDYQAIFQQWSMLDQQSTSERKKLIDSLHLETKKGLDVITQVASEELKHQFKEVAAYSKMEDVVQESLAFCAWAGYSLFLVANSIDPLSDELINRKTTNELGNVWMKNQEKDQCRTLLENIDPVLSMFLDKIKQIEFNMLLLQFPELADLTYKKIGQIDSFINWTAHQGFIIGILEKDLATSHNKHV